MTRNERWETGVAIDYDKLMQWPFPDVEQTYTARDTMLYALGLGLGADPMDAAQLRYVYEDGLVALPMMSVVLASPGFWVKDPATGVDWKKVLHGEQELVVHAALPVAATVIGRTRLDDIIDKGEGKGAVATSTRSITDKQSGKLLAEVKSTSFWRGNGGFGGTPKPSPKPHAIPERAADISHETKTLPQAALIYRLSGDYNPLHADPAVANTAGFARPILHGLCTYGIAGHALIAKACAGDASRLKSLKVRFSSPVYPGETVRTEIWNEGGGRHAVRARVVQRNIVVLDHGAALIG